MTPPTQAQIEAVARIVCAILYRPAPDMSGDIWKAVGPGMKQRCLRAAEDILNDLPAALTAAAEAGESEMGRSLDLWQKNYGTLQAATIERCAQKAENFRHDNPYPHLPSAIAAAIRALKDQS